MSIHTWTPERNVFLESARFHQNLLLRAAGSRPICSRYFATVRRATRSPWAARSEAIFWSESGFERSSASTRARIADLNASEEARGEKNWSNASRLYENAAAKAFISAGKIFLYLCYTETPFEDEMIFDVMEHGVRMHIHRNVGFGDVEYEALGVRV